MVGFIIGSLVLGVLGGVVTGIGVLAYFASKPIIDKILASSHEKKLQGEYYLLCSDEEEKELERRQDVEKYKKELLPPYKKALAEYNEKKAEYDALIEKREAEATKKREAESDRRMKAAQESFDQAEQRERIKKAKQQCFECAKNQRFPKCPMAGTIETVCPNYEPYHL